MHLKVGIIEFWKLWTINGLTAQGVKNQLDARKETEFLSQTQIFYPISVQPYIKNFDISNSLIFLYLIFDLTEFVIWNIKVLHCQGAKI